MENGGTFGPVPGWENLVLAVMNATAFKEPEHSTSMLKAALATAAMVATLEFPSPL